MNLAQSAAEALAEKMRHKMEMLNSGTILIDDDLSLEQMLKPAAGQEIKSDKNKPQLTLVPTQIISKIARVREYGVAKYGDRENWKAVEVERYRNATYRHWLAYIDNPEGKDEESGLPHLWHIACNIAFLCELEEKNAG